jgi:HlyD family secretion protein
LLLRLFFSGKPDATTIVGNGSIEGTEVMIGAKIPGRISSVTVDDGSTVRRGSLLATMDSDEVRARVRQADSQVLAAQSLVVQARAAVDELRRQAEESRTSVVYSSASVQAAIAAAQASTAEAIARTAQAGVAVAEARHGVHAAQAAYLRNHAELDRSRALFASGYVSKQSYDAAIAADEAALAGRDGSILTVQRLTFAQAQAEAAVKGARAAADQAASQRFSVVLKEEDVGAASDRIRRGEAQVVTAEAQYHAAIAERSAVRAGLDDARIFAPIDGTVLRLIVHGGEVVAAGTPILTLVDTTKLFVRVYVNEIDAGKIRIGNTVSVSVDAFPKQPFLGTVSQIDESAQFTPKTVHMADERTRLVYGVKVALSNADGSLKPGMIADARIAIDPRGGGK